MYYLNIIIFKKWNQYFQTALYSQMRSLVTLPGLWKIFRDRIFQGFGGAYAWNKSV